MRASGGGANIPHGGGPERECLSEGRKRKTVQKRPRQLRGSSLLKVKEKSKLIEAVPTPQQRDKTKTKKKKRGEGNIFRWADG